MSTPQINILQCLYANPAPSIWLKLDQWQTDIDYSENEMHSPDLVVPNFFKHELVNVPVKLTDGGELISTIAHAI